MVLNVKRKSTNNSPYIGQAFLPTSSPDLLMHGQFDVDQVWNRVLQADRCGSYRAAKRKMVVILKPGGITA